MDANFGFNNGDLVKDLVTNGQGVILARMEELGKRKTYLIEFVPIDSTAMPEQQNTKWVSEERLSLLAANMLNVQ